MTKATYWGSIEYAYNKKHSEYNRLKGGFVYAFFFTDDVRHYLKAIEKDLEKLNMDIIRVEFVSVYELNMHWENENDNSKYRQIAKKAQSHKTVVFDEFYAYK